MLHSLSHNTSISLLIMSLDTYRGPKDNFKPSKWKAISIKVGVMEMTLAHVACFLTVIATRNDIDPKTNKPCSDTEAGVLTLERLSGTQLV